MKTTSSYFMVSASAFLLLGSIGNASAIEGIRTLALHQEFVITQPTCEEAFKTFDKALLHDLASNIFTIRRVEEARCKPIDAAHVALSCDLVMEPFSADYSSEFETFVSTHEGQMVGDAALHFVPVETVLDTTKLDANWVTYVDKKAVSSNLVQHLENQREVGSLAIFHLISQDESYIWSQGSVSACLGDILQRFDIKTYHLVEKGVFPKSNEVRLTHGLSYKIQGEPGLFEIHFAPIAVRNCSGSSFDPSKNCSMAL